MKIFLDADELAAIQKRPRFEKFRAYRYTFLFIAILAQFILVPLLEEVAGSLVPLVFILVVFGVLGTLGLHKRFLYFSLGLGIAAIVTHYLGRLLYAEGASHPYLFLLGLSLDIVFLLLVVVILMFKVFSEDKITGETIKGGISVYFLLGFLWSYVYLLVLFLDPGAISFPAPIQRLSTITYFSFTTLTTLGYGDIRPVSWMARNLTILQSTIGPIFLTVLIARLVGLHVVSKSKSS